jgi:hypothetical protein
VSDIDTHVGSYGVTFMEKLETGVVQTTTIANSGASAHSRHTIFPDKKIIPTQFYGQCKLQ